MRLGSDTIVLCAVEGIWLFRRDDGGRFNSEKFEKLGWHEVMEGRAFRLLTKAIGKDTLLKAMRQGGTRAK